eukprot:355846-Chlamydomonas_euryale.AAC.9
MPLHRCANRHLPGLASPAGHFHTPKGGTLAMCKICGASAASTTSHTAPCSGRMFSCMAHSHAHAVADHSRPQGRWQSVARTCACQAVQPMRVHLRPLQRKMCGPIMSSCRLCGAGQHGMAPRVALSLLMQH